MADEADMAEGRMQLETDLRIAAARTRMPTGEARKLCVDCGTMIPELRRLAMPGCQRCVDCQEEIEGDD